MTTPSIDLTASVQAWIADDPDAESRAELNALLAAAKTAELHERFAAPLEFGTAGLRGLIGAGPGRMNIKTVIQASAAVARDVLSEHPDAKERGVVIGRDGRRKSDVFARAAAEVMAAHGLKVFWVPRPAPTPFMAYLGRAKGAVAVCIVTASHNPPEYNGFKVYGASASQIVPPQDGRIRALRDALEPTLQIPRRAFPDAARAGLIEVVGPADEAGFLAAISAQCYGQNPPPAQVTAVTTALHGVGHRWVADALTQRGHRQLYPVLAQAVPDGRFPTVRFPNPEEPGALDLALARARATHADLILANDPDTDRLCVAARDASKDTQYRVLTGNEVGLLLADWVLTMGPQSGHWPKQPLVSCSIVSTMMLEALARARGAAYAEVLTGFKWIWATALARAAQGDTFVFGFEEALGYCVGAAVRDKDGVGAAQAMMDLAAWEKARGQTVLDRLDRIAAEIGVSHTDQVTVTLPGMDGIAHIQRIMAAFRAAPPSTLAGVAVTQHRDLNGMDADQAGLPRGDVLIWNLADQSRVVARPSGTEPKLKIYLETLASVGEAGLAEAHSAAKAQCAALAADLRSRISNIP